MDKSLRRRRCRGNLRPAAFSITPGIVRGVLALAPVEQAAPGIVHVPIAKTKLVDRPRSSAPLPETAVPEIVVEDPTRPSTWAEQARADNDTTPHVAPDEALGGGEEPARVAPQALTSTPVETEKLDRREMISRAAARISQRKSDGIAARIPMGAPAPKEARPAVPLAFELRRRQLDGAIAFLKAQCILVFPLDRDARVRRYRVSGKRENLLADEVVEHAKDHGFEVPHE